MPATGQGCDDVERRFNIGRREFLTFCRGCNHCDHGPATRGRCGGRRGHHQERTALRHLAASQECTGCTESFLRAEHPTLEKLILDIISLDYHETLFAAAGHQTEAAKRAAMDKNKGKYLLVVEGAIPMKDSGIYCKIGGRTSLELTKEAQPTPRRSSRSALAPPGAACRRRRPTQPGPLAWPRHWPETTLSRSPAARRTPTISSPAWCTS